MILAPVAPNAPKAPVAPRGRCALSATACTPLALLIIHPKNPQFDSAHCKILLVHAGEVSCSIAAGALRFPAHIFTAVWDPTDVSPLCQHSATGATHAVRAFISSASGGGGGEGVYTSHPQ